MPSGVVQVWCAGCSTGQEAYSLAMLAEERSPPVRLEMVATDLSERVLEKAHAGLYTQFEVQRGLPIRLLLKYFEKTGEMWSVSPRLRAAVRWRRLNLIEDRRSVRRFDLIVCRNVLSYFTPPMRERVLGPPRRRARALGLPGAGRRRARTAQLRGDGAGLRRVPPDARDRPRRGLTEGPAPRVRGSAILATSPGCGRRGLTGLTLRSRPSP